MPALAARPERAEDRWLRSAASATAAWRQGCCLNFSMLCRHRSCPQRSRGMGRERAVHGGYPQLTKISRRRFLKTVGFSGAGMVGLTAYGIAGEAGYRLNVTRYHVSPPQWTPGLNLSIGVIADVHAGGPLMPAERIRAIAERTNELKPDIIVLLGDFAASHKLKTRTVAPEEWAEALSVLKAPLGVHAILGNHDWWDDLHAQRTGEGPVLGRRVLEAVGIPVYENDAVRLDEGRPAVLARRARRPAGLHPRPAQARLAQVRRRRRSSRHARQDHGRCARRSAGARARHFPARARARVAHAVRAHARRPGAPVRLFADGAVALRQPLRLRPHRRRQPQPDRVRRARLLDPAGAHRRSA